MHASPVTPHAVGTDVEIIGGHVRRVARYARIIGHGPVVERNPATGAVVFVASPGPVYTIAATTLHGTREIVNVCHADVKPGRYVSRAERGL